jgi:hypothetical protein
VSYLSGANPYTSVGSGTLQASTGAAGVTVSANASTLAHDLIVAVLYAAGDVTLAVDAGEGWVLLDGGYNAGSTYGCGLFACISARAGATRAGLTLASSVAWTLQCHTYRPIAPFRFTLAGAVGSRNWFNSTASSTANARPAFARGAGASQFRAQGIELTGGGYNNAGTTTTAGNITNYTERFDTGQVSPAHGVALEDLTTVTQGTVGQYGTLSCTLAAAKTNHGGVRAFVPLIVGPPLRGRYASGRRLA